jgi:serine/threonine protein kinase
VFEGRVNGIVCAVKEIEVKTAEDERYMVREVEILMKLHHPHVVKVLGECNTPWGTRARTWEADG